MERNRFLTGVSDESPAEFISKAFRSQLNELIYRAITKLCKIHTPRLERLASFDYKCTFSINLARHPGAPPRIIGWNGTGSAETRIEKATRNRQDAARNRYTFGSSRNKIRPSPVLAYSFSSFSTSKSEADGARSLPTATDAIDFRYLEFRDRFFSLGRCSLFLRVHVSRRLL